MRRRGHDAREPWQPRSRPWLPPPSAQPPPPEAQAAFPEEVASVRGAWYSSGTCDALHFVSPPRALASLPSPPCDSTSWWSPARLVHHKQRAQHRSPNLSEPGGSGGSVVWGVVLCCVCVVCVCVCVCVLCVVCGVACGGGGGGGADVVLV